MRLEILRPRRDDVVDAGFAIALTALGLVGLRSAFGGWSYLTAGLVGMVVGLLVGHTMITLRLSPLRAFALACASFVVVGTVVAGRESSLLGLVPTHESFFGLVDGLVSGWRRLLTSLPPSGTLGNLLAVPYAVGFVAVISAYLLARRTRLTATVVLPASAALTASILFGTRRPFSLLVQGALFAGMGLAWAAVRTGRRRQRILQSSGMRRLVVAGAMLVLSGVLGLMIGPRLPLADANDRFVLRAAPPFDPRQHGSPLNSFQRLLIGEDYEGVVLFTVEGLQPSEEVRRIRLAAMDDYDGVVWRVTGGSTSGAAEFLRVGSSVRSGVVGESRAVNFRMGALPGIWVPTVGTVAGVRWSGGARGERLRDLFRLSVEANTAVVPVAGGWAEGDRYTIRSIQETSPNADQLQSAPIASGVLRPLGRELPDDLAALAAGITKGEASPYAQAKALETWFRQGYYKKGDEQPGITTNPPGHSIARLRSFLQNDVPVGNAEQYAASMALFARTLGLPARVVMGFRLQPGSESVRGEDVDAWVEVGFADAGWVPFYPTPYENTAEPDLKQKQKRQQFESTEVPPPPIAPPPSEPPLTEEGSKRERPKPPNADKDFAGPSGEGLSPLVVGLLSLPAIAALVPLTVVALKRRRRNRRRQHPEIGQRVAGGWQELIDLATDAQIVIAATATRREAAVTLALPAAAEAAAVADTLAFSGRDPVAEDAEHLWSIILTARRDVLAGLGPWAKVRAAVNPASLRRHHPFSRSSGIRVPSGADRPSRALVRS